MHLSGPKLCRTQGAPEQDSLGYWEMIAATRKLAILFDFYNLTSSHTVCTDLISFVSTLVPIQTGEADAG